MRNGERETYLNDNLHQILLRNNILATNDLLQNTRQNQRLVHPQIDTFELRKPDQIRPDKNTQLASFHLALFTFARVALVLESDPEFVHLDKVCEDECDRVVEVSGLSVFKVLGRSNVKWDGERTSDYLQ